MRKSSLRNSLLAACALFAIQSAHSGTMSVESMRVRQTVSGNVPQRETGLKALRERGKSGLQQVQTVYADDIAAHRANSAAQTPNWESVRSALAKVGGQYDNWASGLYWFTDLERAKTEAKSSGKPILSLRLLGRLDEDLSCANSRFFRTALYANKNISRSLNDDFILHWSSERPAPIVTIDMGDGRILKRTLTGNSVHYLMDGEGRVLDALPGLFGPGAFARWLKDSQKLNTQWRATDEEKRDAFLAEYHKSQIISATDAYIADYEKINREVFTVAQRKSIVDGFLKTTISQSAPSGLAYVRAAPSARSAGELTASKITIELPILNATRLYGTPPVLNIDYDSIFSSIAPLHAANAQLDESSKNLMRAKTPQRVLDVELPSPNASQRLVANAPNVFSRVSNQVAETPINVLASFQNALALDTVRNKYRLHIPIHKWFADGEATSFETLNTKIYNDLFWTPKSDPWLGLAATGSYTALDDDGVSTAK